MNMFTTNFKWIMLASGILTSTLFLGLFSPQSLLTSNFGETIDGNIANIVVRSWSALIGLIGIMLIYGAFTQKVRNFTLIIASISKLIFIILVLSFGKQYLSFGIGTAVIVDTVMISLYAVYLLLSLKEIN